jgi:hypothetical protein
MGKKTNIAKASLATAFLAAGGTAATQASAGPQPHLNPEAEVSSYFGPLGLRDDFQHYVKLSGFDSFFKFFKVRPSDATNAVIKFSNMNDVAPPPGFRGDIGE